jgi:hypothetical protein
MKVIFDKCPRVRQIYGLGQPKYKMRIFSKKPCEIKKIIFVLGSYESFGTPGRVN